MFTHLVKEQAWKNGSIQLKIIMKSPLNLNFSQEDCLESDLGRPNSSKVELLKISEDRRLESYLIPNLGDNLYQ